MGRPPVLSGFRCYHCGSLDTAKDGYHGQKPRFMCRTCRRGFSEKSEVPAKSLETPAVRCYHCGSFKTSKAGFHKGKQRYFCRGCRRGFRQNPRYIEGTTKANNFWVRKHLPSAGHLILELQAIAQNVLKRTPQTTDIAELSKQNRSNSLNTYRAVFGGFREALRRARLTPDYPKKLDPEKMLEQLRALRKQLKRPLLKKDIQAARKKGKAPSFHYLRKAFGSPAKAIDAAGAGRKKYNRAEIIDFLCKLDAKIEWPLQTRDIEEAFRKSEGPSLHAIWREFGGMERARRAAGIKRYYYPYDRNGQRRRFPKRKAPPPKFTADELIAQLRSLEKELGRRPTSRDINQACKKGICAYYNTFAKMFGSLPEALRAARDEG